MKSISQIGLLGFGEVGHMLAEDLGVYDVTLCAYDTKFAAGTPPTARDQELTCASPQEMAARSELIISAVTAEQTVHAAKSVLTGLKPGTYFLDLNSASPGAKTKAAEAINGAGGLYVEAAIMSPVDPKRLSSPILLGGPYAEQFKSIGEGLGLANLSVFASDYGKASAAKLCRSVVIKGLEALLFESLVTARRYGVEDTVLTSLSDLLPGPDWEELSLYMIERSLEHGERRSEEMREAGKAVRDVWVNPLMSNATAQRQLGASLENAGTRFTDLTSCLDALSTRRGALEQV
ncbi:MULTISPECIES: DUF1932 domain-containing protein [Hyphomonas]|uniref:DUF1932 domain-containing protein n=1 Tax=Hyphomonas TaxID=85 RepID=UPI000C69F489|nr:MULTISPECIES: DUF1932 domain-containing protein [Hyphomonas]MBB38450.1 6-phosphogluconate dehydrogenase [Hyphomonas sp.]|tara:strand:- start:708 stop:1583 length:876 start_codon:yes stop_codon:yes gene_type:complete